MLPTLGNEMKKNKISDLTGFELRDIGISIAAKPKTQYRGISIYNNFKLKIQIW